MSNTAAFLPVAPDRPPQTSLLPVPLQETGRGVKSRARRSGVRSRGAGDAPDDQPAGTIDLARARRAAAVQALAVLALSITASAARPEADPARGADLFARHCAVCHGAGGGGDGPLAARQMIPPTNLTELGAGEAFPTLRVAARIDGRDPLVSHGSPMPIWGDFLTGPKVMLRTAPGQPILVDAPVADLVAYIATLQAR